MGWEAELKAQKIALALGLISPEYRDLIVEHLRPVKLQRVVRELLP